MNQKKNKNGTNDIYSQLYYYKNFLISIPFNYLLRLPQKERLLKCFRSLNSPSFFLYFSTRLRIKFSIFFVSYEKKQRLVHIIHSITTLFWLFFFLFWPFVTHVLYIRLNVSVDYYGYNPRIIINFSSFRRTGTYS